MLPEKENLRERANLKLEEKVSKANIRLKPIIKSTVISQAPPGAILISERKEVKWYRVDKEF